MISVVSNSSILTSSLLDLHKPTSPINEIVTIKRNSVAIKPSSLTSCLHSPQRRTYHHHLFSTKKTRVPPLSAMATTGILQEVLPASLDSTSDPPSVFDGTTRLYISYTCPYAQRVWITRNCKGLQDKIELVPLDLQNRPDWYKEKVYPQNKDQSAELVKSVGVDPVTTMRKPQVPSLEHNNQVIGESLDLIKYLDSNFEGPALLPDDPAKREFSEELLAYTDTFNRGVIASLKGDPEIGAPFDYLETALSKFEDGPFLLGQFSLVDIAYAPFVERYYPLLLDVKKYDITTERPKLASWIEELDKIEGYKQTKRNTEELTSILKKRFMIN